MAGFYLKDDLIGVDSGHPTISLQEFFEMGTYIVLESLDIISDKFSSTISCSVKINTGMGRLDISLMPKWDKEEVTAAELSSFQSAIHKAFRSKFPHLPIELLNVYSDENPDPYLELQSNV
jgi:hypothetical protein